MLVETTPAKANNIKGAWVKSLVLLPSKGKVTRVRVTNRGATAVYLMTFDLTALPANATVPDRPPIPLAAGSYYESDTSDDFDNGCVIAGSSTMDSITLMGAADLFITGGIK